MKDVNKVGVLIILFCLTFVGTTWSQTSSQRLKNEQKTLERQINNTKALLEKSKKSTQTSLEEVNLITRQIEYREQLLRNIDNQIRSSELKIEQKEGRIKELNEEIEKLKHQYSELLLMAYKKRNKYGELMYIFSAKSVEEALKRKLYLEKLTEIQQKQMRLIQQNQTLLEEEIAALEVERKNQLALADQKKKERAEILKTKQEKEIIYQKFKKQEDELRKDLIAQEKNNQRLKQEIAAAIQREIAEERARREAEARKRAEEAKKKAGTPTVEPPKTKEEDFLVTAENKLIGDNFVSNKGRLPWPVSKGTITQNYGKNKHPYLDNVYTQNNGIDISTVLNAEVLSVFKGEVTTVINIPGAGKVVIIKHGNFRTVYSNLQDVFVTKGSMVETKTPIGTLLPNSSGDISIAHFEIHQAEGNNVTQLNPNLWLSR